MTDREAFLSRFGNRSETDGAADLLQRETGQATDHRSVSSGPERPRARSSGPERPAAAPPPAELEIGQPGAMDPRRRRALLLSAKGLRLLAQAAELLAEEPEPAAAGPQPPAQREPTDLEIVAAAKDLRLAGVLPPQPRRPRRAS